MMTQALARAVKRALLWAGAPAGLYSAGARHVLRVLAWRTGASVRFEPGRILIRKDTRVIVLREDAIDYAPGVLSQFEVYHGAVEPTQTDGMQVVDYSGVALQRLRPSGLELWTTAIAEEEDTIRAYFTRLHPREGDVVFDVGANCGLSTWHLSKMVGSSGRVFAFEPDPGSYAMLRRNIEYHGLSNVVAIQKALAGRDGTREFNAEGSLGSAFSDLVRRVQPIPVVLVPAISLQSAVQSLDIDRLNYVKMDVEGAELEIIDAARPFLLDHSVDFAIETDHVVGGALTNGRLEQLFTSVGYWVESRRVAATMTTWAGRA